MPASIIVKKGDTLSKIAKRVYGDGTLATALAHFNGIDDPNQLLAGQTLVLPSRRDLVGPATPADNPAAPALPVPNGLDEVIATFGDIRTFIRPDGTLDPGWEAQMITRATLPFSIPLSGSPGVMITRIACHKKLADTFIAAFKELQNQGLQDKIVRYGGCFVFRQKRLSQSFSTHSWGIAMDLNPETNAQGTSGNMDPDVIKVFQSFGFKWGGEFSGKSKDPMHFQYCTGF
jgi:LysM repeat protein